MYLNLETVQPALAGPKRPQDRILLADMKESLHSELKSRKIKNDEEFEVENTNESLKNGSVVLAAITSCTNTSNPYVMVTAGLVAKKAHDLGLKVPSFVKTSLAPGSKVVVDYLENAGLLESLSDIGFKTVGFGCTTCIGNSGPLPDEVANLVTDKERCTTMKRRFVSGNQQVLRVDRESRKNISRQTEEKILDKFNSKLSESSVVIISDYNKGVLTRNLLEKIIKIAKLNKKIVIVDPKNKDFSVYKYANIITPNLKELLHYLLNQLN